MTKPELPRDAADPAGFIVCLTLVIKHTINVDDNALESYHDTGGEGAEIEVGLCAELLHGSVAAIDSE